MPGLKATIVVLAILIAAALGLLVWRMVVLLAGDAAPAFGERRLGLPAGCRILEATTAEGRLVLRIGDGAGGAPASPERSRSGEAGCDRVLVVDPADGRVLGAILP